MLSSVYRLQRGDGTTLIPRLQFSPHARSAHDEPEMPWQRLQPDHLFRLPYSRT